MPRYRVYWDEVVTYCVEVEAENADEAYAHWADPAYWDSETEIVRSDFDNNWEVEEI